MMDATVRKLRRSVAKLAGKLALAAAPLLALLVIEAFVMPLDFCTFRCWEALSVRSIKWAFPGPFYPNQQLSRVEEGDLGHGTKYAVSRQVTWVTDEYGFRNRESRDVGELDVVIVGDSFVAGTGLTQDQILPEVLEREHGFKSYGFAPANMKHFLRDPRFSKSLPKIVILAIAERSLSRLSSIVEPSTEIQKWAEHLGSRYPSIAEPLDRILSPCLPFYAQALIRPERKRPCVADETTGMLFHEAGKSDRDIAPELRRQFAARIREYQVQLTARGSKFVFVPIPDKELVYEEKLATRHWPTMIPELVRELSADGIPVVNMIDALQKARAAHPEWKFYQLDDTHWDEAAVEIAAEQISCELKRVADQPALSNVR